MKLSGQVLCRVSAYDKAAPSHSMETTPLYSDIEKL